MKFIEIIKNNQRYYGGNQDWFPKEIHRKYGCGVIAATNMILTLLKKDNYIVSYEKYMEFIRKNAINKFLIIPAMGIDGFSLAFGVQRIMKKEKLPYRVHWGCFSKNIMEKIETMLEEEIPVILAVGPAFRGGKGKLGVTLYKGRNQKYYPCQTIKGHYVTVTAMDQEWMKISSWGECYYINKMEYLNYMKTGSFPLFTNVLLLKKQINSSDDHT